VPVKCRRACPTPVPAATDIIAARPLTNLPSELPSVYGARIGPVGAAFSGLDAHILVTAWCGRHRHESSGAKRRRTRWPVSDDGAWLVEPPAWPTPLSCQTLVAAGARPQDGGSWCGARRLVGRHAPRTALLCSPTVAPADAVASWCRPASTRPSITVLATIRNRYVLPVEQHIGSCRLPCLSGAR